LSRAEEGDILTSMQGLLNYPLKPAFSRSNPPEFRPVAARTVTSLGGGGASVFISLSWGNPVKYLDPDGRLTENTDGTVTFDKETDTLAKGAEAAGWDNWKDALKGNNEGAIFYRGYQEVDVTSWYDDDGNWIGGDNTLVGTTMSNKEPMFTRPTAGIVSSNYGMRKDPITGEQRFHGGVDIRNSSGTRINTAAFGVVAEIGTGDSTWGNYVIMRHGSGYTTRYAHLSKIAWGSGVVLHRNTKLGEMGSTGYSTGSHLHYGKYRNGSTMNPNIR
jgi:murein DD-endopeptidase MepM/ murein hydrolase activator NlpD